MAELTTTNGTHYIFKPDAVLAISDRDRTCILGLTPGVIQIAEPVTEFLRRIDRIERFAHLDQGGGTSLWVSALAVSIVRLPLAGEFAPAIRAVVIAGSVTQGVLENPDEVRARINAAGGNL